MSNCPRCKKLEAEIARLRNEGVTHLSEADLSEAEAAAQEQIDERNKWVDRYLDLEKEVKRLGAKAEHWQRKYDDLRDGIRYLFGTEEAGGER